MIALWKVQFICCCKLAIEPFTIGIVTLQYVFTANSRKLICFEISNLFKQFLNAVTTTSEKSPENKNDVSVSDISYCKTLLQLNDSDAEVRHVQACDIDKIFILDSRGTLYFAQILKRSNLNNSSVKDENEAILTFFKINLNFKIAIFALRNLENDEGNFHHWNVIFFYLKINIY